MICEKRPLTLNLTSAEMRTLEDLSRQKELSKTAVLRQALRLYQLVDARLTAGAKLYVEDENERAELMVL
jgi:hypothetical protein